MFNPVAHTEFSGPKSLLGFNSRLIKDTDLCGSTVESCHSRFAFDAIAPVVASLELHRYATDWKIVYCMIADFPICELVAYVFGPRGGRASYCGLRGWSCK